MNLTLLDVCNMAYSHLPLSQQPKIMKVCKQVEGEMHKEALCNCPSCLDIDRFEDARHDAEQEYQRSFSE